MKRFCRAPHNIATSCSCGSAGTNSTQNPGLPEKGLRKNTLSVCFFTVYYSPLFTIIKKISNTVS
ncbi:hypothetical protein FZI02_06565 [Cronobacter sakazakii]|nr:hypothetical protein [Cronobacter sakazakii]EGT5767941.1 hypothetical protein [Cronobacter sakazakii]KAB0841984.1 hypothetical protein FZI02_06565 [Cronobacter sakazakii]KAB0848418.1 hypothetical protein FZI45_06905 [Cronobacter sakazakii]PPX87065.1 hypothetical protein C3D70_05425 [Cronobacter sakazakii]